MKSETLIDYKGRIKIPAPLSQTASSGLTSAHHLVMCVEDIRQTMESLLQKDDESPSPALSFFTGKTGSFQDYEFLRALIMDEELHAEAERRARQQGLEVLYSELMSADVIKGGVKDGRFQIPIQTNFTQPREKTSAPVQIVVPSAAQILVIIHERMAGVLEEIDRKYSPSLGKSARVSPLLESILDVLSNEREQDVPLQ